MARRKLKLKLRDPLAGTRERASENIKKRREMRQRVKEARIAAREEKKLARIEKRKRRGISRTEAREQRQQARLSKRQAKKMQRIYGDLDPETVNQINQIQPYTGAMAKSLDEQGVELKDPNDPIEVASKYVQTNDDMDDPIDDEVYNDAFLSDEEIDGDYRESYDKLSIRKGALRAVKGAFGGVLNEFGGYVDELRDKKLSGGALSKDEERILNADKKVRKFAGDQVLGNIADSLKDLLPLAIIVIVVIVIAKKAK